jgi:type I restriction enzyme M protein
MRWRTLKPTLFEFNGEPIFKSQDIMSFQIDESRVDKAYLINELHADYVTEQIESNRIGAVFPSIRIDELLDIKIHLPSLENQKAKLQGALEFLAEEKKKELVLFKKIHGLETEIVEQNTYLRHSLAGPTSNLKSSLENIKNILTDKVQNIIPDIMSLKVSDRHELTFGKYLEIIERDINKISDAISKQLKVETDIDNKPLEYIDIVEFLNKMNKEYSDKTDLNFTIEIDTHEEALLDDNGEMTKVYILGNKSLLTDLFDNFISNAVTHAFSNEKRENKIEILLIKYTDDAFKNEISILVSNTGKPLPNGFKHNLFIRKGLKAGDNAGNGFGGWYINEIIKKMDGSFEIIDERGTEGMGKPDLVTSFEINFPILEIDADEKV